MYRLLFFMMIVFASSLWGCKNKGTAKVDRQGEIVHADPVPGSDDLPFVSLDLAGNLNPSAADTVILNDLAKNIRYVPLKAFGIAQKDYIPLYTDNVFITELENGRFVISDDPHDSFGMRVSAALFDSTGRYERGLFFRGRGPKELVDMMYCSVNPYNQIFVATSSAEILVGSVKDGWIEKFPAHSFTPYPAVLADSTLVLCIYSPSGFTTNKSVLYFTDLSGAIKDTIPFPTDRKVMYRMKEGEINQPYETYGLKGAYYGALFRDVYNDTVYRIRHSGDLEPGALLKRGKLAPKIENANDSYEKKAKFISVQNCGESEDYFFIHYVYDTNGYSTVWSKPDGKLVMRNESKSLFVNVMNLKLPSGEVAALRFASNPGRNKLYTLITSEQASEFIPDVKYDDDPVLVIIEL